ncbi:nickel-dependent hydrogenase large subunit [Helicobacter sp. MIT 11-5569]|uniref:nickel-dependent hydrogenase large subunit n=1 Tax=Helicobacter sp. MIT 11-5569 TaxID=1548151 RepID=UPI00051FE6A4|nr:nickel-dependent hydrogenase large subunit [Helicobacter sp. MIT 11-5569]TLD81266.1 nickel-dependent hydrogenase large subunit [Helicobacter sp. MIT 11-5569]
MTKRIIVDPITRIEGHLRIEVIVDENNVITDAYSSSTLWRGLEVIVKNRDPRDVGFMVQRICGVCTYSHYKAGITAVENALGIKIPFNAEMVRSLMNISLVLHDHLVHFYHLHGLDWCDITEALKADPKKASELAFKYSKNPIATGADELANVQERVKKFASAKQGLGPFANAYWGHKTYKFSPEQNLIVLSHYLKALEVQRVAAQMMAIFGAKQPHPQSLTVGGVTCVADVLDPTRLGDWLTKYKEVADFINRAYYADVVMAAEMYKNEPSVLKGCGVRNFLCHAEIPVNRNETLYSTGIVRGGDISKLLDLDEELITEEATHSWYANNKPLHPYDGETEPNYTGFVDKDTVGPDGNLIKTKALDIEGKYSWIKSPRYNGEAMEVGPLAAIVVGLAAKNPRITKVATQFLEDTGLPLEALFSTLGRTAARVLECKLSADYGIEAFNSLVENLKSDQTTCAPYNIDNKKEYKGRYIGNVPRGTLSHWVRIKDGVVSNYQCVVPSTWNAGPKDSKNQMGPYEASLVGIKIQDITQPLEIIRTIHSFDPCIACAVHLIDTKGNEISQYKINPIAMNCNI